MAAILFWRDSAIGVATIAFLCAGDGFAEVFGRAFGAGNPLPHNPQKVSFSFKGTHSKLTTFFQRSRQYSIQSCSYQTLFQ